MRQILLLSLVIIVFWYTNFPSASEAQSKAGSDQAVMSTWGEVVDGVRCRVKACNLTPANYSAYSNRINISIQIENISKTTKMVRILAPISGEPGFGVMMKIDGEWETIGNALIGPKTQEPVHSISPKQVLEFSYSEGLKQAEVNDIVNGSLLKCVIIAYGKGSKSPASLFSGEFSMKKKENTEQIDYP